VDLDPDFRLVIKVQAPAKYCALEDLGLIHLEFECPLEILFSGFLLDLPNRLLYLIPLE